jgi:hypothetical protein
MENPQTRRSKGLLGPLILIVVGIVLLLERSGVLDRHTLWQWIPLLPLVLGGALLVKRLRHDTR